jgi:hypothetical protein
MSSSTELGGVLREGAAGEAESVVKPLDTSPGDK